MKFITALILSFAAIGFAQAASPKPQTLDYDEASLLYGAISNIGAGLEVDNVANLADDINLLTPFVKKYDLVKQAASKNEMLLDAGDDPQKKIKQIKEESDRIAFGARREVAVVLKPVNLTSDEIKAAKITPAVLSQIRCYLYRSQ